METANEAMVRFWNSCRKIVSLEGRKPSPQYPPPLREQVIRLRTEILPMLELDLKHDLEHWLADVDTAVSQFNENHFKRLSDAWTYCLKLRNEGRTAPGFRSSWQDDKLYKPMRHWLPVEFNPLMPEAERTVVEGEELLALMDFKIEAVYQETYGLPLRARLWWRVIKPEAQEVQERELARRVASRQVGPIYRKTLLVVTLRARVDQWIIERLGWLDRPPGRD